ncbi:hypothetical protein EWB00_006988 [Schistosoma japonicum]|uniref:Uncharacterized protein n=1 Tax=Schistosoma japonicum TaxID=6182 RepID=A0A4Z2CW67_SCHJA|nr:hypothetical protein EWB00_006988 [Schistosoma japonicum]TNN08443.1 hypothetical protein EWB00_006988 [Schistosoma japonicum]
MHLEQSSHNILNHGISLLPFTVPTLVKISLVNYISLFFMINSSVDSEMDDLDDDGNRLVRRKWCPWSSWSPCSPTKCFRGFVNKNPFWSKVEELSIDDGTQITRCVLPPANHTKKPNRAYVQQSIRGQHKILIPEKQRFRTCDCQSVSLLNVFRLLSRHECSPGDTVFECSECGPNEKIHSNRDSDSDADLIPYCSYEQSGFQLYKILGGVIGAIGIVCLLVCLVRFLIKQICGDRRLRDRSVCGGSSTNGNGNTSSRNGRRRNRSPQLHINTSEDAAAEYLYNHRNAGAYPVGTGNVDLPPAYTDVVKLSTIDTIPNDNTDHINNTIPDAFPFSLLQNDYQANNPSLLLKSSSNLHTRRFSCALYDTAEQIATSSQTLNVIASNTPPPPSYEEIVAMKTYDEHCNPIMSGNIMNIAQMTPLTEDTVATTTTTTTNSSSNVNTESSIV